MGLSLLMILYSDALFFFSIFSLSLGAVDRWKKHLNPVSSASLGNRPGSLAMATTPSDRVFREISMCLQKKVYFINILQAWGTATWANQQVNTYMRCQYDWQQSPMMHRGLSGDFSGQKHATVLYKYFLVLKISSNHQNKEISWGKSEDSVWLCNYSWCSSMSFVHNI